MAMMFPHGRTFRNLLKKAVRSIYKATAIFIQRKVVNNMKIIVTPEEMRSNASNIRTEKANFEQCISSMRSIVNSMSGVFEGQAATAYKNNFDSYNAQFTQFGELIESFAQKLDSSAATFEETDQGMAGSMG
jgi:WXG100 family type VII secretion target